MHSRKNLRLVSVVSVGLLSLVCTSSEAGRSIRSDASDSAFDTLGGFWGTDAQDSGVPGVSGDTAFKLNLGNGPRVYTYCMSEDGFIKFITAPPCSSTDFTLPPTGNYIAVFATDLDVSSGFLTRTRGFVDTTPPIPYQLTEAAPAMRFWWNGVTLFGDANTFDVQVTLIDRSQGTNNGNFDIEFNYGNGSDKVPPTGSESNPNANGVQGFKLGSSSRGPVSGPFGPFDTNGAPIRFCFRNGKLRDKC